MPVAPTGSRPVVHLFIGLHKTGTSAVRLMLDFHGAMLARHGFHLPRACWTRYINRFWNGGHNNVPWEICGHHPVLPQFGTLADLVSEIAARPRLQHIVFSEDLDYANGAQVQALAAALSAFDVRVIVFLRNQPDWLQSHYTEEHKWFGTGEDADWFLDRVRHDRRLHLDALCIRWARAFGNRLTIRCYEDIRTGVFGAFLDACGAPTGLRDAFAARAMPLVNASPDARTIALVQAASSYAREQGIGAAYFNRVMAPALVTAGAAMPRTRARIAMSDAARTELLVLMQRVNQAVAGAFGLELGAEYWALPAEPESRPEPALSPQLLMEMCIDLSTRAATRLRVAVDDPGAEFEALADSYYPWDRVGDPASRAPLHALLADTLGPGPAALYLERRGNAGAAYRQHDGTLTALRSLGPAEWDDLVRVVRASARLNRVSWNNLCEGLLRFDGPRGAVPLWVRLVPAVDGEVVMIEPVDR